MPSLFDELSWLTKAATPAQVAAPKPAPVVVAMPTEAPAPVAVAPEVVPVASSVSAEPTVVSYVPERQCAEGDAAF